MKKYKLKFINKGIAMYKKFILNLDELEKIKNQDAYCWHEFVSVGREGIKNIKNSIKDNLDEFTDPEGILQADSIINNWFPSINADIFISHSHKDEELVLGLSGWLKKEFRLTAFIDSVVWGYSDELLKNIDDKYCLNNNSKTYNYSKRNRSTSHVHMMLSTALMNMIDRCEMFLFIETRNSFRPLEYLKSKGETESPWIYSELSLADKIRENIPKRFQKNNKTIATENLSESLEDVRVKYPANISDLITLTFCNLIEWKRDAKELYRTEDKLDRLYSLKGI